MSSIKKRINCVMTAQIIIMNSVWWMHLNIFIYVELHWPTLRPLQLAYLYLYYFVNVLNRERATPMVDEHSSRWINMKNFCFLTTMHLKSINTVHVSVIMKINEIPLSRTLIVRKKIKGNNSFFIQMHKLNFSTISIESFSFMSK